jgi:hypothetical protein
MRRLFIVLLGALMVVGMAVVPVGAEGGRPVTDIETTWTGQVQVSYDWIGPNPYTPAGWYFHEIQFSGVTANVPGYGEMTFSGDAGGFLNLGGHLTLVANGGTLSDISDGAWNPFAPSVTLDWAGPGNNGATRRFNRVWPGDPENKYSGGASARIFYNGSQAPPLSVFNSDPNSDPPAGGPYTVTGTFTLHLEYL